MNYKYNIKESLIGLGRNLTFQGEVIGESIQKNKYQLGKNDRRFYLFNIYDIDTGRYLGYEEFINIANKCNLNTVPFLDLDFKLIDNIDELVELSKGQSVLNPKVKREGIVIKTYEEIEDMQGRVSFKVINPDFLIKYKE